SRMGRDRAEQRTRRTRTPETRERGPAPRRVPRQRLPRKRARDRSTVCASTKTATSPTKLGSTGRTGTGSTTGPRAPPSSRSQILCRFSRHVAGLKTLYPLAGGRGAGSQRPRPYFSGNLPVGRRASSRIAVGLGARSSRAGFRLPDGDDSFDLVHRPGARGERLGPVGRGTREDDGVPSDRNAARAVDDRHLERTELLFRPLDEFRQGPQRHRPVDLVVEGTDLGIRSDRPEDADDGPRVVPAHAVHDRLDIYPGSLRLAQRAPPLTGGKRATSSPSRKTLSDRTTSWFTARSMRFP